MSPEWFEERHREVESALSDDPFTTSFVGQFPQPYRGTGPMIPAEELEAIALARFKIAADAYIHAHQGGDLDKIKILAGIVAYWHRRSLPDDAAYGFLL
jgi:hypothetical protein